MTTAEPRRAAPGGASWSRRALALGIGLVLLVAAVAASLMAGSKATSATDVWHVLTGVADPYLTEVVRSRYARTALGVLVGAGLAAAGLLMQAVTRNPLAEPGLLGINMGAAAAIVTATAFLGFHGGTGTVWWALPGAVVAGLVVHVIGVAGARSGMVRLVLAGAVVSAVLSAYIQAITLSLPKVFDSYRHWVVGSLAGSSFATLLAVLPFTLVGVVLAVVLAPALNVLALGEETATAVGVNAPLVRAGGLVAAILLSAAATAAVGPVAFVGLAVPHIVRALVGADFRVQIPFALLFGPSMLLAADAVGRVLIRPQELMVGVVSAFIGVPFLLYAVRTMRGDG